jgi:hypothetical protein
VGSQGEEAGASILVMLEDDRFVSVLWEEAFAAEGMGTSTLVLVRRVAIKKGRGVASRDGVDEYVYSC